MSRAFGTFASQTHLLKFDEIRGFARISSILVNLLGLIIL